MLEARDGVLRFRTEVPLTPVEQAAVDGDAARLTERLAELQGLPAPAPPTPAFIFNPAVADAPATRSASVPAEEPRRSLTQRLADLRQAVAAAEQAGQRPMLVRALKNQIAELAAQGRPPPT